MSSGFRYVLAGACAIALLFVAFSMWPYFKQMDIVWRQPGASGTPSPQQHPAVTPSPAPSSPAPPPALGSPAPASAAPAGPARQLPSRIVLQSPAQGALLAVDEPDSEQATQ